MKIPTLEVVVVPLGRLLPWTGNPRKDHAVDAIAKSIESFGYLSPIVVQKNTMRVLAGHGRLAALDKLGVVEVPVVVADVTDDQADLFTLADNKLGEASDWDFSKMADLLLDFDARNLDTRMTGFTDQELHAIANWTPKAAEVGENATGTNPPSIVKCPGCGKEFAP